MTAFYQTVGLASSRAGPFVEVRALVDTGCTFTWVSGLILRTLGVSPDSTMEFETADGRVIEREVAEAVVLIDGKASTTKIIFCDEGTVALLGVHTLEAFLLTVDPVNERLVPVRGLLKALSNRISMFEYEKRVRPETAEGLFDKLTTNGTSHSKKMSTTK
ncbi:MAG: hypothetical protein EXR50_00950 [Dehalococcoidia bacterium]|nr:hypothetical protein [Dehalococcoidia bacterium]